MSGRTKRLIREEFKRVESFEPDKSTEYLFEIVRQNLWRDYGIEVDFGHIAEALEP